MDTLQLAKDLKAAGMPADQADGTAAALGRAVQADVASKADIMRLSTVAERIEAKLDSAVTTLEAKLERDIARLGETIAWRFNAVLLAIIVGVIVTVVADFVIPG